MEANQMPNIRISNNTEVLYTQEELEYLRKCVTLDGFLTEAKKHFGLNAGTIKNHARDGKGRFGVVSDIRKFLVAFKQASLSTTAA